MVLDDDDEGVGDDDDLPPSQEVERGGIEGGGRLKPWLRELKRILFRTPQGYLFTHCATKSGHPSTHAHTHRRHFERIVLRRVICIVDMGIGASPLVNKKVEVVCRVL